MEEIKVGPIPKYQQLAAILRRRIAAMEPGDPIPSETELEMETGLARGTIKKAVALLRNEGLIVTTRGLGSFVAEHPPADEQ
ncbi:regulatory protein, gntR family [Thermomonospora echinospora]|uniref:Regulatory protein, gntR family n=1 Tax=Thermomonospora echinospora TaxID=1992 RepID=A0A1H6CUY5_9ACTN|nr:GntR family transcriptional regulator [Thermomonospora echinospora]SEG76782.1 regulatory protein, gntR family [Thermomonospora echinospora]